MIDIWYYDTTLKRGGVKQLSRLKHKPIWIDLTDITKEEASLLQDEFNFHHLSMEDFLSKRTRIKIEEFSLYLLCIFYGVEFSHQHLPELVELDFILGKNFLITHHKKELETYTLLKKDKEKLGSLLKKGTDFLLHDLLYTEMEHYFSVLEYFDKQIEELEQRATEKPRPRVLKEILRLKRRIVILKKSLFTQREHFSLFVKSDYHFISKKALPYFRDLYDQSIFVSDEVENYREAIGNTFDVYMSALSNNMNEIMKTLSVIATVVLPLTVISSIYGTNFDILPGSQSPYGFWIMISLMILFSISIILYFKKRSWF